jgi:hypothetical protein
MQMTPRFQESDADKLFNQIVKCIDSACRTAVNYPSNVDDIVDFCSTDIVVAIAKYMKPAVFPPTTSKN